MDIPTNITLESVLKASPDSITITDLEGKIIMTSQASLKMFGYSQDTNYLGKDLSDFLVADDRLRAKQNIGLMFSGTMVGLGEYHGLRADGSIFDIEVNGQFIADSSGKPSHLIFVIRDITERKKIEFALKESEEKYRTIAENTTDGILTFDAENKIVYVSPGYTKLFGYSEAEELSRNIDSIASIIHPDDQAKIFADIFQAIKENKSTLLYSYRMKHKNGNYIWREDNAKFSYDESGKYLGSYVVCRDISEHKRVEEELRNKMEQLEKTNKFMVDRELRMVELKEELQKLKDKSNL